MRDHRARETHALPDARVRRSVGGAFDPAQDNILEWVASHDANGTRIMGHRLADRADARTVRLRQGRLLVTDGPFAETREQLGGYYLIEAKSMAEAQKWAARCPAAIWGHVEIREVEHG